MDVFVQFWSETHIEVGVKYLTSVMFGHAAKEEVVKEMLGVLDKLAIPVRLMLSLGMDGPNVNKSVMHKINQVKKRKLINHWLSAHPAAQFTYVTTVFRKVWIQYWGIMPKLLLILQEKFVQTKRPLWNWGIPWSWRGGSAMSCSELMVVICSSIAMLCHNQGCS